MKIAIITFWDSQDNYGQIMQSYALSTYLSMAGHSCTIIRYKPFQKASAIQKLTKLNPAHIVAYYKYRKQQKAIQLLEGVTRDFDSFRSHYLHYSNNVYYGFDELWSEDWSSYDAFICGSDQIWSPKPDEQLNAYFLQFAPFKSLRIAYAPSFGRSILPDDYQRQLHQLLIHFDAVSAREVEGVNFSKKANISCRLVCDPTLLLTDTEYRNLTKTTKRNNFVFCYLIKWETLFPTDEVRKVVANYAGIHYFCTNGQEQYFDYEKDQTIENWLSSIQRSSLSLTNSFHGIVFSIISHTPFVAFPLTGKDAEMNSRLFSLLSKLGLEDRIYSSDCELQKIIDSPIDWAKVDARLETFRQESQSYLASALTKKLNRCEHNICFLTRSSVHHNYGGLDRVTELLAEHLKSYGANVYFVSQRRREIIHEDLQFFLPDSDNFHSERNAKWLNSFLHEHNIDVLINQEGNVDLTLPINHGVKRITVLHFSPNYISNKHFDNKFKRNPLLKWVFRTPLGKIGLRHLRRKLALNYEKQIQWADCFVMLSDLFRPTLSGLLSQGYDHRKVIAINNPMVIDKRFQLDTTLKEKTILYVGRIDNAFKNVDTLIRIWGKIAALVPDWNFEICGQGGEFNENQQLIAQLNIPRCNLVGLVEPTDYYKKSSIIVMASEAAEGWGMVLVEAMQYGCVPLVLNSYASVRDIIQNEENGILVEPGADMETRYANHLLCLIRDDEKRAQMMHRAIESIQQFDIEAIGNQWLKLINE